MCTTDKPCFLHAISRIAQNLGAEITPAEHTKLGTVLRIEQSHSIGNSWKVNVSVNLVEVGNDRWSLRASVSVPAVQTSDTRILTLLSLVLSEVRDSLAQVDLFISQNAHATQGWWSTKELVETVEQVHQMKADLISHLEEILRGGQHIPTGNHPVGEA